MDSASATARRTKQNSKMPGSNSSSSSSNNHTSTTIIQRRPPYLPTTLETVLLSIYPSILILGSAFSLLDPSTRAAPYNTTTQSHHSPDSAPSYFAKKSNLFNVLFVKRGWAWVTLSYFFFLFTHPSTGAPFTAVLTRRRIRGALRWGVVTIWWIFITQWFFGPPFIDRGFVLTGGQCELLEAVKAGEAHMHKPRLFLTGVACKAVGGEWRGGHDISGHVFLLVLGSMFLLEEVLYVVLRSRGSKEERTVYMRDGAVKSAEIEAANEIQDGPAERAGLWTIGAKVALGVAGLSIYMLLMTAAYFHTWLEKLTGLLVAFAAVFSVYCLPRVIPALRDIIGVPGI